MNISGVSPEALVMSALEQRNTQAHLEAQVSLVKGAREAQSNAVMSLIESVPMPQPDGSLGNNVDVRV